MLKAVLKRTKSSSRDAIMEESYMKGSHRLYALNSQQAQNRTGNPPQSSNVLKEMSNLLRSIKSNHITLKRNLTCNIA